MRLSSCSLQCKEDQDKPQQPRTHRSLASLVMKPMNSDTHSCTAVLASLDILAFSGSARFMMRLETERVVSIGGPDKQARLSHLMLAIGSRRSVPRTAHAVVSTVRATARPATAVLTLLANVLARFTTTRSSSAVVRHSSNSRFNLRTMYGRQMGAAARPENEWASRSATTELAVVSALRFPGLHDAVIAVTRLL